MFPEFGSPLPTNAPQERKGCMAAVFAFAAILAVVVLCVGAITLSNVAATPDGTNEPAGAAATSTPDRGTEPSVDNTPSDSTPSDSTYGQSFIWTNGLKAEVLKVVTYTPSAYAIGHRHGNVAFKAQIAIRNDTGSPFNCDSVLVDASLGDEQGERVYDDTSTGCSGVIGNGKVRKFWMCFSAPKSSASVVAFSMSPSWEYEPGYMEKKISGK